jgi:uncharacterized protein YbdZ (MbtH family)
VPVAKSREGWPPDEFVDVANGLDQYAVWPPLLEAPPGWRRATAPLSRGACLAAVAGVTPGRA